MSGIVKSMLNVEVLGLSHSIHRVIHNFVDKEIFIEIKRNFLLVVV